MGNTANDCVTDRTSSGLTAVSDSRQLTTPTRTPAVDQIYRRVTAEKPIPYSFDKATTKQPQPIPLLYQGQEGVYVGDFERGEPHGVGQLFFSEGNFLEAIFQRGQVECRDGLLIEASGNYYRGGFRESRQNGKGVWCDSEGTTKGYFEDGCVRGEAEWKAKDGRVYLGRIVRGLPDGKGKMTYPSGQVYEGYWRKGKKSGLGYSQYAECKYYGPYVADKKQGKGSIFFIDGARFEGWFQDDKISGYGEWHRPNGTKQKGNFDLAFPA